jgi:hypothetical protein
MAVSLSLFFSNIARYWDRPKFDYKKRICIAMVRRVVKLTGYLTRQCGRASPLQEKGAPRKQPLLNPLQIMGVSTSIQHETFDRSQQDIKWIR